MTKKPTKQMREQEERDYIKSLPADRFGVNPKGSEPIEPKGTRKGSKRKVQWEKR